MQKLESNGFSIGELYDLSDPKLWGKPFYFDLKQFITTIEMFIASDEIQTALWLLDNPPGWYRENYPKELTEIRNRLYRQTYDTIEYASDPEESACTREFGEAQWGTAYTWPRCELIERELTKANAEGKTPWILDVGCSHGNLPLGLIKNGFKFTYRGLAPNQVILNKLKEWTKDVWADEPGHNQKWLVCTEVIEHTFDPTAIVHSAKKLGHEFDQVWLSVPLNTLGGGLPDWKTRRIGHVRTWTHKEFIEFAMKHWPEYSWTAFRAPSQVLHGVKL